MSGRSYLAGLIVLGLVWRASAVHAQFNPYNPNVGYNPYAAAAQQQQQWLHGMQAQVQAQAAPHMNPYGAAGSFNPYGGGASIGTHPYTPGGTTGTNPYSPYSPGVGVGLPNPFTPNPFTPYPPFGFGYNMDPYGLYGSAALLNSYGNFANQAEQARMLREQALQSQIETAKKRFEFQMYVKANTPTFTQEQAKVVRTTLKRIQSNSTPAEISSGKALNILLDDIRKQLGKKVTMDADLDEEMLRCINVVKDAGNLGLLRDNGKFTWPVGFQNVLTADEQKRIELTTRDLVEKAFDKDAQYKVDANLVKEVGNLLDTARAKLTAKVNELPTTQYLEAKRFLNEFDAARLAIERNEVPAYLKYREFIAGGQRVSKVADYLVKQGLQLAPATGRDEAAYRALHTAMAAYDIALNTQGSPEVDQ